jgi:hypothetical protein
MAPRSDASSAGSVKQDRTQLGNEAPPHPAHDKQN